MGMNQYLSLKKQIAELEYGNRKLLERNKDLEERMAKTLKDIEAMQKTIQVLFKTVDKLV
jgi:cell division protein FtsB